MDGAVQDPLANERVGLNGESSTKDLWEEPMYAYLVTGSCEKSGQVGPFSLSVNAQNEDEAKADVVTTLEAAGFVEIVTDHAEIQRTI